MISWYRTTNATLALSIPPCLLFPGWLYDYTGSYDPGFLVSGAMIALGGVMLFVIPCAQDCEKRGQRATMVATTVTTTASPSSAPPPEVTGETVGVMVENGVAHSPTNV